MSISKTDLRSSFVPSVKREGRSVVARLASAVLSYWHQRTRGSPPLDNYLRRDIGLEPVEQRRDHWDYR
jgi:hypothetical protein